MDPWESYPQFLLEPNWEKVKTGDHVSVVINVSVRGADLSMGHLAISKKQVRIVGDLGDLHPSTSRLTLFGVCAGFTEPYIDLCLMADSVVLPHAPATPEQVFSVVELCSGLAGSSFGLAAAGFRHLCSVEWNEPLASVHRSVHDGVPVVVGDVACESTLLEVKRHVPHATSLVAGFSCQPFSVGGAQGGGSDPRAQTLPAVAKAAWLLQAPLLILECVVPARTNAFVRQHLRVLHEQAGYCIHDEVYHLEHVWAAKRFRWWVVLSAPCFGQVPLDPLPDPRSSLVVRDLLPYPKDWPEDQVKQLMLTTNELSKMQMNGSTIRSYMVDPSQKLATALHSWGNQCQPCECGCRTTALSDNLLRTRGVFAQVMAVKTEAGIRYRHLTCQEVALLCGLPPLLNWTPNARLNLCAVGQLASPLQSVWVGACIQRHICQWFGSTELVVPAQLLWKYKQDLMRQADILYPKLPPKPISLPHLTVTDAQGCTFAFPVSPTATLRDFMVAQSLFDPLLQELVFVNAASGDLAQPSDLVAGMNLRTHPVESLALVSTCLFEADERPCPMDVVVDDTPDSLDVAVLQTCLDLDSHLPVDPLVSLLQLKPLQLQTLLPPVVTSDQVLDSMLHQYTAVSCRLDLLHQQQLLWADDEIRFALSELCRKSEVSKVSALDPLLVSGWWQSPHDVQDKIASTIRALDFPLCLVSVVFDSGHWIPVVWKPKSTGLEVYLWEHDLFDADVLWPLHQKLCVAYGCSTFSVFCTRRSFGDQYCGIAALAFLAHKLLGSLLPISVVELDSLHHQLRQVFASRLSEQCQVTRPWCFASGTAEVLPTLSALLQFHGVPAGQSMTRARLVLQSLGKDEVAKAVHGTAPWKTLKALANLHVPPLQLVLPDEQAAKTQDTTKPKSKKAKGPSRPAVPATLRSTEIDPSKLSVDTGVFCCGKDTQLRHLPLSQVGPLSSGIALTTYQDAAPFLKQGVLLATGGLALLILDGPDEPETALQWSTVRFAARCTLNKEPMLLTGTLVQLGRDQVFLHSPQDGMTVPAVEVACARITVFKDQWPQDWHHFTQRPVKNVLETIPCLTICRASNCTCPKWHATTSAADEPVLDVFRRQFFTEAGRPTAGDKAAHYGFMIRYLKDLESQVLLHSGKQGVYVEPKTEDATRPSPDYQVIWLPSNEFADAQHRSQCEPHSLGLARHNARYGIRVASPHYQAVFQTLKPDALFLAPGPRTLWTCGPFPYGVDRKSLGKILKTWQWDARPMQPSKSVQGGLMWTIQAVTEPPATVYSLPHGQVVVSKHDGVDASAQTVPRTVIGQSSTVKLCKATPGGATDPWLTDDPWKPTRPATTSLPATEPHALQALEKRLEESILAKLPAGSIEMEVDTNDDRVTKLEQQVQVLMQQHQDLEVRVQDNHTQATAQVQSLQGHMQAQFEAQGKQMQTLMDDQMARLESILTRKTPRGGPYDGGRDWQTGSTRHRPGSGVSRWNFTQVFFQLLVFMFCVRIGEAKVPGPSNHHPSVLQIGLANPSGIQGKYQVLSDLNMDLLLVSETHHTAASHTALSRSWKATRSNFKNIVAGCPMQPRSTASDAGQWAGVLMAAAHPLRPLSVPWPVDLYATGRIQFATAFCSNVWVSCGLVYGYPEGSKSHVDALDRTNAMLDFAVDCMLDMSGPRIMGGDWNWTQSQLHACARLESYGWREVQDLELQRSGLMPRLTCKNSSRKDFLYVSPELVCQFRSLDLDPNVFSDHVVFRASFDCAGPCPVRYLWPCPTHVPWSDCCLDLPPVDFTGDPSVAYQTLWTFAEQQAKTQLGAAWTPDMAGRAAQTSPKTRKGWPTPLRTSRSHEVQPSFFGFSVQHARWFRQLRRLQAFCAWRKSNQASWTSLQQSLHGVDLWNSIRNASGFQPSFECWWPGRSYHGPFDPAVLPVWPPDFEVASAIYDAMLCEVRLLEDRLNSARKAKRTHDRHLEPNLVFRDVRRAPAAPVESLLHTAQSTIAEVHPEELKLSLTSPCPLDLSKPVFAGGVRLDPIHFDTDALWVSDVHSLQPGDIVCQSTPLGRLDLIFDAFHTQWKQRWGRHDEVPFSRWDALIGFASRVLRPNPVDHLRLSAPLLRAEAKRKKPTSATGLDGVSRMDLLQVPEVFLESLLGVLDRAEKDGAWPAQILAGKVTSLAKCHDAQTPNQFRPITVFGLTYRLWTSVHARRLLDAADVWAHDGLQGNRKQRQTAHLWKSIALGLEEVADAATHLHGLTADIEKCFNCLPRWPIFALSVLSGTPEKVNTAWAGAVTSMVRHFKVRDSLSHGISSSTGLAEGCALSCYGMLLLDHVFHLYVECQGGGGVLNAHTFVDDWTVTTQDASWAVKQLDIVLAFAELADLTVDKKKTLAWSTSKDVRAQLRTKGITVADHARELGAHLGYSRRYTNCTVTKRIQDLDEFWPKLRASPCPWKLKIHMLRTVAWPRGLHAVSSAPLGQHVWTHLRQRVVGALSFQKPGVNPHVLVGLAEASVDPEFTALLATIKDARAFCPLAWWTDAVYLCALGDTRCPPTSPAMVLVSRIQPMGISVLPSGLWTDQFGVFDPVTCNFTELTLRLSWSWQHVVAAHVSHRPDFLGLGSVDVVASRRNALSLSLPQQALLRLGRCGGSFTEDFRSHWTGTDDCCKWCGEPDSLAHRYWKCPQTQPFRDLLAPTATPAWHTLPPAVSLRGWALRASTWFEWTSALLAIPTAVPPLWGCLSSCQWNDVFTDGSCFEQAFPDIRIAAWGAVVASPFVPGWIRVPAQPLCSGVLPGLCQTAFRAELFALAVVLHWASLVHAPVRVWMDCLGVINKFVHLTSGKARLNPVSANADLWQWILLSVDALGMSNVEIFKVKAHHTLGNDQDPLLEWKTWHNRAADRVAVQANGNRPRSFWNLRDRHWKALQRAAQVSAEVQALHVAVAEFSSKRTVEDPADEVTPAVRQTRVFEPAYTDDMWNGVVPPALAQEYGWGHASRVVLWWQTRTADRAQPVKWWSFVQLYTDFQLTFGCPGPIKHNKQWLDVANRPFLDVTKFPFRDRVRWFRRFIQNMLKHAQVAVRYEQCRPESDCLQAYLPCVSVRWDPMSSQQAEIWLQQNLKEPCTRAAGALTSLPRPNKVTSMAVGVPPNMGGSLGDLWSCRKVGHAPELELSQWPKTWKTWWFWIVLGCFGL